MSRTTNTPTTSSAPARHRAWWWVALGSIVLVGAVARLWNLDWDRGQHLHPDERHWSFVLDGISMPDSIGEYFATGESPLDPYTTVPSFVYGTFPLFVTEAAASILQSDAGSPIVTALDALGVDLRADDGSLRFDNGYDANLVGRLLSGLADSVTILLVGCLARLLAGRTAGLFAAGSYALAVLPVQQAHFLGPDAFATMFATGAVLAATLHVRRRHVGWLLAAAALVGAAMACRIQAVLLMIAVAVAVVLALRTDEPTSGGRWRLGVARFVAAAAVGAVVFRVAQPYAFDGWWLSAEWVDDLRQLRRIQAGADIPPSLQWVGRTRLLYPLGQLVLWGIGPALTAAAAIGGWALWRRRELAALVPGTVVVAFLALIASTWTPTMRYLMPIVPMVAVAAGVGLAHVVATARTSHGTPRRAVGYAAAALVLSSIVWGLAFLNGVYGHTNSRVAATEWIAANVPPGSTLSVDAWDDALPLRLEGVPDYRFEQLQPTTPDSTQKIEQFVDQLARIDVIVVSSQRSRDSVERLPARFPSTLRYYAALEDGSLGFDRVASFQNLPRLGPFVIDTSAAEEAFSVYDHPPVDLYLRTDRFSVVEARRILDPALASTALSPPLMEGGANALLATPAERDAIAQGETFDELFPRGGASGALLWIAGWAVLVAASVVWSVRLLPRSPAGAAGLSLALGPLTVTVVVWSLVAWGLADLSTALVRVVAGAFVLMGAIATWWWRADIIRCVRRDRVAWITVAAVAGSVFAIVLALRLGNPDLWHPVRGGEKPMELAYFTSVARSPIVPPPDPWFAGGVLNYYYLGFFHLAVPARALGVAPEVAFQLGLATVAASAAGLAAAVGHDVIRLVPRRRGLPSWAAPVAGVVSAIGLLVVGNLDAARQVLDGSSAPFDWWAPSRVHEGTTDITEFPAWSILFGDLHPHLMATWLTGLVVLLGVALVADDRPAPSRWRRGVLALLGLAVGAVQMTHTWDLPAVLVLSAAAIIVSRALVRPTRWRTTALGALGDLVVVGGVAFVLTAPYRRRSMVFNDGIEVAPVTTRLVDQLVHLGVWWAVAAAFALTLLTWRRSARTTRAAGATSADQRTRRAGTALLATGATLALTGLGLARSWVLVVSIVLIVLVGAGMMREARRGGLDPATTFVGGLLVAGVGLAAVPELVIVAPDIDRMNTVFKLTFAAWQLLALAAGPALVLVAGRLRGRVRTASAVAAVVALAAVLTFPILAIRPRLADRVSTTTGPTLDGLAYLDGDWQVAAPNGAPIVPAEDRPLVDWLRAEVEGQPTIVEMVGPLYAWNGRVSVLTGLPTVLGWQWHQTQQRLGFVDAVDRRFRDVQRLYTVPDEVASMTLLRAHRVEYIVIGTVELATADPAALELIESMPGAEVVFRDGDRRIVAIDQGALADALGRLVATG